MITIPENALILVGIMPSPKDLEIARLLGWYRIPLKSSPKIIDVDYLAFYQGANFPEDHRAQIEFIAEYRGHELTTRGELLRTELDHPRAKEEYYKIQIGSLMAMSRPIRAEKWKRLTFIYSLGKFLNSARSLNDLVVPGEDRDEIWKCLRERARSRETYRAGAELIPEIDPAILELLLHLSLEDNGDDLKDY